MGKRLLTILCILMTGVWTMLPMAVFAKNAEPGGNKSVQSADRTDGSLRNVRLTVRSAGVRFKLTGSRWIMLEGRKASLGVLASPSGNIKSVSFSSSNEDIVSVSSAGKLQACAKGTAKITVTVTARDASVIKKTCKIKVIAKTVRKTNTYRGALKWKTDVVDIGKRYDDKPQNCVLFYGNSSIRKWETLEKDMEGMSVLNHGFGGSLVNDCLYYADKLVIPYSPRALVFYAGTNDIARGYSTKEVYRRTKEFFEYIHCRFPDLQIYYLSMPLQPKREEYWPSVRALNKKIREYCKNDPLVTYIKASAPLNKGDRLERSQYFLGDGIHLTRKAYNIWTQAIRPVLLEDGYADQDSSTDNSFFTGRMSGIRQLIEKKGEIIMGQVDPKLMEMAQVFHVPKKAVMKYIILPAKMPGLSKLLTGRKGGGQGAADKKKGGSGQ